ncbi:MAG: VOC family protein [Sandaracinaceae bacterium]
MSAQRPFHLAFPVTDLAATERFYVDLLGCRVGRRDARWIDFDLGGHQISAHLIDDGDRHAAETNAVDGDDVPARHFGLVLPWDEWEALGATLRERGVSFLIEPRVRFVGQPGEQGTFFLRDPSGNAIEMKSFKDLGRLFAT